MRLGYSQLTMNSQVAGVGKDPSHIWVTRWDGIEDYTLFSNHTHQSKRRSQTQINS